MLYASYRSKAVRNNAGGHYNHTLFWELLNPSKVKASDEQVLKTQKSKLYKEILNQYGSLDNLKMELNKAAATRFDQVGRGWLLRLKRSLRLQVAQIKTIQSWTCLK